MATKQYFKRKTSSGYEIIYPYTDANAVAETSDRVFITSTQKSSLTALISNAVTTNTTQTISGVKTFTAETEFTNSGYCPTFTDIANGIGKSSCFTRGAFMQAIVGQVIAPNTAKKDESYGYNIESGIIKFQKVTDTGGGAKIVLEDMASISSDGIKEGSVLLSNKYSAIGHKHTASEIGALPLSGGQMTGPLSFNGNTALPQKSLSYICGIDAFANGGQMGWQSKSEFLSGYALSNHNHDSSYSAIGHTHSNYATSSHVHRYITKSVGSTDTMYLEMNDDTTVQMRYKTPNEELIKIFAYTDHDHDSTYIKLAEADTAATANKIVKRDSSGHITGNYIKGTWLYTSSATEKALSSAKGVAVLGTDGYIYYRTLANLKSDLNVPTITVTENDDDTVSLTIS